MFYFLLIIAVLAVVALVFYLVVELNEAEKSVVSLVAKLKERYAPQ